MPAAITCHGCECATRQPQEADDARHRAAHQDGPGAEAVDEPAAQRGGDESGDRAWQEEHHAGVQNRCAETVSGDVAVDLDEFRQAEEAEVQPHADEHRREVREQDCAPGQHRRWTPTDGAAGVPSATTPPGCTTPATATPMVPGDVQPQELPWVIVSRQGRQSSGQAGAPSQSIVPSELRRRDGTTTRRRRSRRA